MQCHGNEIGTWKGYEQHEKKETKIDFRFSFLHKET